MVVSDNSTSLLKVDQLSVRFGGTVALDNVSFSLVPSETVGIIGPNGAGKTTLFGSICGYVKPTNGTVVFADQRIDGLRSEKIARLGIRRTFQNVRLFRTLTVRDNIALGCTGRYKPKAIETKQRIENWLERLGLTRVALRTPGELTLAEQKTVEVGRASIASPRLLLLDEMFNGLTELETDIALQSLAEIREEIGSLVIIEHVLSVVRKLCPRVLVFDSGRLISEGTPTFVLNDQNVRESYLGSEV